MQPLRLFVFLAFIGGLRAYELPGDLAEFYCVVNGNYSNRAQVEKDGGNRPLTEMRIQPVLAPAVSPVPLIYFEEYIDRVLARALVHIITQIDGVIYTDPKNFTGKTGIKPGSIDVNKIKALTPEDLHGHADCQEATEHAQPLVFAINYPVCELAPVKGKRESYGITFTCKDLIFTSPGDAPEKSSLEPNHLKLQGPKYPLENAPDSYVCDCDKSSD